jgi:DEAD/DEAH box helicase domain-containing protein
LHKHSALEILERINDGEITELEEPREGDKPFV